MSAPLFPSENTFTPRMAEDLDEAESRMYRDEPLSPKMISTLLHVGAPLHSTYTHEVERPQSTPSPFLYGFAVITASVVFAGACGALFAYMNEIGPFYAHTEASQF